MKKLIFLAVLITGTAIAQDRFEIGANVGIPVGSTADFTSFALSADFSYLFEVAPKFDVGVATGFVNLFSEDVVGIDVPDIQYIPVAAAASYKIADQWGLGVDVGYGFGVSEGSNNGFYFRPRAEYSVSKKVKVVASSSNWYEKFFGEGTSSSLSVVSVGAKFYIGDGYTVGDPRGERED